MLRFGCATSAGETRAAPCGRFDLDPDDPRRLGRILERHRRRRGWIVDRRHDGADLSVVTRARFDRWNGLDPVGPDQDHVGIATEIEIENGIDVMIGAMIGML